MSRTTTRNARRFVGAVRHLCARLARDARGNTLILVAASLLPLIALVGSGIDMGRGYLAQARLQQACDAAALAGRRAMTNGTVDTSVVNEANKFFRFNFPIGTAGRDGTASFGANPFTPAVGSAANSTVTVTAATTLPTTIMKMFGFNTLPLSVTCFAKQDFVNTDIALVLDTTGSMDQDVNGNDVNGGATSKIAGLRSAVMALYDQLTPVQTQLEAVGLRLRYSIIPYSSTVNVGNAIRAANASYIKDASDYQTRVANYDKPVYAPNGNPVNTPETLLNVTAANCLKYGYNQSFSGYTPAPAGEPVVLATTISYYMPTSWGGSSTISGSGNKACIRTKTTYLSYTTRYAFSGFSFRKHSVDTSDVKMGTQTDYAVETKAADEDDASDVFVTTGTTASSSQSALGFDPVYVADNAATNINVLPSWMSSSGVYYPLAQARIFGTTMPINTAQQKKQFTWDGSNACIEERATAATPITSSSGYGIPGDAYDLNIDLVPNSDATRWSPHWPQMIWFRTGGSFTSGTYNNKSMTPANNAALTGDASGIANPANGYYACPSAAVRLKAFTRAAMQTYVNGLTPLGGTYHDIGMIWGARFLSPEGIFAADNPTTYGNMPVSRYIIFLTDGQMAPNPNSYTAYGVEYMDQRVTGAASTPNQLSDHIQRLKMICNSAKSDRQTATPKSVSIWVIAFATALDPSLSECASSAAQASTLKSQAELIAKFTEIGKNIGALRLTQ